MGASTGLAYLPVLRIAHPSDLAGKPLSPQETQVIRIMAEGNSPADVARRMGLSIKTISTYTDRIRWKLQARNNYHAIRIWILREIGGEAEYRSWERRA